MNGAEVPPQENRSQLGDFVRAEIEKVGIKLNGERVDLTTLSNEQILQLFDNLMDSDAFVLHGTNAEEPYETLEPRQANDAAKESGNKEAVYATIDKVAALNHAIFNTNYIRTKLRSFTWGESSYGDGKNAPTKVVVNMSPELYQLFEEHDPNVLSDGYVYVLDKANFITAPDAGGAEFHSETKQLPIVICKVSKQLGDVLFVVGQGDKDTVREYTSDDLQEIAVNREKWTKK